MQPVVMRSVHVPVPPGASARWNEPGSLLTAVAPIGGTSSSVTGVRSVSAWRPVNTPDGNDIANAYADGSGHQSDDCIRVIDGQPTSSGMSTLASEYIVTLPHQPTPCVGRTSGPAPPSFMLAASYVPD